MGEKQCLRCRGMLSVQKVSFSTHLSLEPPPSNTHTRTHTHAHTQQKSRKSPNTHNFGLKLYYTCYNPRLIAEKPVGSHTVEVSVVEIYNNDIRDLLSGDPNAKHDVITGPDGSLNIPTLASK